MIRPRLKHVRHPLRSAAAAARLAAMYFDIWEFGRLSSRRYRRDSRFDLDHVSRGFAPRSADLSVDIELLRRICAAYNRAAEQERSAPEAYQASGWWRQVRNASLGPVTRALETQDLASLAKLYSNFYRDPCSAGLVGVPYGMNSAYFGGWIHNLYRRFYLGDALHTLDYWDKQTGGAYSLHELEGPDIGNPFGILLDGVLVRSGSAYQHYTARKVISCLGSVPSTVVEIGGGFGGMAYYLLRDQAHVKYIDFDVPESLALTSYYLLRSFPHLKFLLYGEEEITPAAIARADVVLMPTYAMNSLASTSADVVFSSHAISDISHEAMQAYVAAIARMTSGFFLYMGDAKGIRSMEAHVSQGPHRLQLQAMKHTEWNSHRCSGAQEVECVFNPLPTPDAQPAAMPVSLNS
jgi:hypothetical protein